MGRWAELCREENVPGWGPWPDRLGAGPAATPMGVWRRGERGRERVLFVRGTGCSAALRTWSLLPASPWEKLTSASQLPEMGHTEPRCSTPLFKKPW